MMRILSSSNGRLLTLGLAATLLAGCANYGSFDENEPGLEESILGPLVSVAAFGVADEEEQIDYSPRAALVAPPDASQLPAPQDQTVATTDANWPTGSRERLAQVVASEDQTLVYTPGVDGIDIAATQAVASGDIQQPREDNGSIARPLLPGELEREAEIERARAQAAQDAQVAVRGRRYLTDPPVSARAPSPEAPYGAEAEEAEEDGSWSWWPF